MKSLRASFAFFLISLNTIGAALLLYPLIPFKWLSPTQKLKRWWTKWQIKIGELWIGVNNLILDGTQNIEWDLQGAEGLSRNKSYLISSNHQSWVDILVLQRAFNRRIPFLRFFLKQELIFVPFIGLAWWALDFPFMKRYSKEYLAKHPEKQGTDLETTRRACEKFKGAPVSIINFLEGTRFTEVKHGTQSSPYRHLLLPKAGGLAFVLQAMGEQFASFLDVTIVYPDGPKSFFESLTGEPYKVVLRYEVKPIPNEIKSLNYANNKDERMKFQEWVSALWERKDRQIENLLKEAQGLRLISKT